jgi:hypothetical protein
MRHGRIEDHDPEVLDLVGLRKHPSLDDLAFSARGGALLRRGSGHLR